MRTFSADTLLVATHNNGKLEEIADLLKDLKIAVIGAAERGLPEHRFRSRNHRQALAIRW
ncbi:MAG: non-canonical purine NTP pyrophosphatase, partial [Pseudomonadota bacterium]